MKRLFRFKTGLEIKNNTEKKNINLFVLFNFFTIVLQNNNKTKKSTKKLLKYNNFEKWIK